MITFLWCLATFVVVVPFCSTFEWTLHRYYMHQPIGKSKLGRYAFVAHALVHHHIFKADHTYHLQDEKDKRTIPMAWWNGAFLTMIGTLPFIALGFYFEHPKAISITAAITIGTYYGIYERIHWCMHLPRQRNIERTGLFFRLNGHHLLHHRYMHKNFNVVLPFADLIFGTLLLRSKVKFAQATGPAVPNVQPLAQREQSYMRLGKVNGRRGMF